MTSDFRLKIPHKSGKIRKQNCRTGSVVVSFIIKVPDKLNSMGVFLKIYLYQFGHSCHTQKKTKQEVTAEELRTDAHLREFNGLKKIPDVLTLCVNRHQSHR